MQPRLMAIICVSISACQIFVSQSNTFGQTQQAAQPNQNQAYQNQANQNQQPQVTQNSNGQIQSNGNRQVTYDPKQAQQALTQVAQPTIPEGFPLDAESQKWVDDLLNYWEGTSKDIKAYKCDFKRWHYMPQFLNYRDPTSNKLAARMVTIGEIRYANPGRGRYDINEVWHFNPPEVEGGEPQYKMTEDLDARANERESWITDGKSIFEFDYINKRLNVLELPAEMQGEGLKNSPLPFVFGAQAADLKSRFWIRPMSPEGLPQDHYMIEAIPKTITDARSYSKVQIVLSQKPFLPVRVELFAVNFQAKTNPESIVLLFENRKINDPIQLAGGWLSKWFSPPTKPAGWEIFKGKLNEENQTNQIDRNANRQQQNLK